MRRDRKISSQDPAAAGRSQVESLFGKSGAPARHQGQQWEDHQNSRASESICLYNSDAA